MPYTSIIIYTVYICTTISITNNVHAVHFNVQLGRSNNRQCYSCVLFCCLSHVGYIQLPAPQFNSHHFLGLLLAQHFSSSPDILCLSSAMLIHPPLATSTFPSSPLPQLLQIFSATESDSSVIPNALFVRGRGCMTEHDVTIYESFVAECHGKLYFIQYTY